MANQQSSSTRRRWPWIVGGGALVVIVLVAVGIWWYLRDDAPPEVSLEAAVEALDTTVPDEETTAAEPSTTEAPSTEPTTGDEPDTDSGSETGVAGTWAVDTSIGTFDFESATGSFVGFRVQEELTVGSATAVGRTGAVSGTITIDGTALTEAAIEADLTAITTNDSRRDDRVQDALETDQTPTATFVLTEPVELGEAAETGDPVTVVASGELTIHGVTNDVEIPLEAQLVDETVVVTGSLDIVFADYDVTTPSAPIVLSVDDEGVVELQLLLTKA